MLAWKLNANAEILVPEVFIGVGSNVNAEQNIRRALVLLSNQFGKLTVSPAYLSRAIGFVGDDFINLVVAFHDDNSTAEIHATLAKIEVECGRTRETPRYGPRTLDLDLLLYGNESLVCNGVEIPRPEILKYAFVLRPLADIAAENLHPRSGETFGALWRSFSETSQVIQPLEIEFG